MSTPLIPVGFLPGASPGKPVTPVVLPDNEVLQDYMVEWWYFISFLDGPSPSDKFAVEMTAARLSLSPLRAIDTVYIAVIDRVAQQYVSADRQSMSAYQFGLNRLSMRFDPSFGQPGAWCIDGWTSPALRYEISGAFAVPISDRSALAQRAIELTMTDGVSYQPLKHGPSLNGVIPFFGLEMGYYSRTRLDVAGHLKLDDRIVPVSGSGWMDHEWGTADLPGSRWTFCAIQLDSGIDLCAYRVDRRFEGTVGPTYGYRVSGGGVELATSATIVETGPVWADYGYPLEYDVTLNFVAGGPLTVRVTADFQEQRRVPTGEIAMPFVTLWEGAATVKNPTTLAVIGRAFLEMGGYE
jgi:predicted secreted hydrolase